MSTRAKEIIDQLDQCLAPDRLRLRRRIDRLQQKHPQSLPGDVLQRLTGELQQALSRRNEKLAQPLRIGFPGQLPISGMIDELSTAIRSNPVTVVCGETGSGKSTQLPKICVQLGLGREAMIGHTQPRRIAARTIAERIAAETGATMGQGVGYKIRHTDKTSHRTWIKVMTDGVLLAELQQDRDLNAYDAIIVDEAHERSLNIDFILGYLKQLSARRPQLRIIVTSATIDVARFSEHFTNAPVIEVAGRSYPVDIRYRPIEAADEDDEIVRGNALLEAVQQLGRESYGDILVFLDDEREIRDMQKFLQKQKLPNTDILPLYSRLGSKHQARIFSPHSRRHVILATNVAETSLTIDGIKYVIDFGLARISRYSYRSKVQRLPIEKISRASANQRSGRCGRTSEGVCIRLYSREDFESRPEFTDPEILRTNLASVILQMKALRLGEIADFDFIEPPDSRYINDGLRLLDELGALNRSRELTPTGRAMARLPLEPRLSRIILATKQWDCLEEILVIVSALSIQDPRERPLEQQQKADQSHAAFMHPQSDFLWFINFWNFYQEQAKTLSRKRLQKLCKQNFVSAARMLEWQDIHAQLAGMCRDMGLRVNTESAPDTNIHCAILTGLPGHVAQKSAEHDYTGARGSSLNIFPGSALFRQKPKWIVAYELVETSRLYARTVAKIDPEWLLKTARHLLQYEYSDPHWDPDRQQVMAREKVSIYGLVIVAGRALSYAKIDRVGCRKLFIREALVHQGLNSKAAFYRHNRRIIDEVKQLETRCRRPDILDEEAIQSFYEARLPGDVFSPDTLDSWRRQAEKDNREILFLSRQDIMRHDAETVNAQNFPDSLCVNRIQLPLSYHFNPGDEADGVNVDIPLYALNQVSEQGFERLVPGLLEEKIVCLLKSLPKALRKQLVPVPETARACLDALNETDQSLRVFLSEFLFRRYGIQVDHDTWDMQTLPEHLKVNFRIIDESGHCLARGRDLAALKDRFSGQASRAFIPTGQRHLHRPGLTDWDFDDLPETTELEINGTRLPAYPALVDYIDTVELTTFDTRTRADFETRHGVRRLLMLRLAKEVKYMKKRLRHVDRIRLLYATIGDPEQLIDDLVSLVFDHVFGLMKDLPRSRQEFTTLLAAQSPSLVSSGDRISGLLYEFLDRYRKIRITLADMDHIHDDSIDDINRQLEELVYDGFLQETPVKWLEQYPRYFAALEKRMDRLANAKTRDLDRIIDIQEFESAYYDLYNSMDHEYGNVELEQLRWMLQEYRVSLFAQEMKTLVPVSAKRIKQQIEKIRQAQV